MRKMRRLPPAHRPRPRPPRRAGTPGRRCCGAGGLAGGPARPPPVAPCWSPRHRGSRCRGDRGTLSWGGGTLGPHPHGVRFWGVAPGTLILGCTWGHCPGDPDPQGRCRAGGGDQGPVAVPEAVAAGAPPQRRARLPAVPAERVPGAARGSWGAGAAQRHPPKTLFVPLLLLLGPGAGGGAGCRGDPPEGPFAGRQDHVGPLHAGPWGAGAEPGVSAERVRV